MDPDASQYIKEFFIVCFLHKLIDFLDGKTFSKNKEQSDLSAISLKLNLNGVIDDINKDIRSFIEKKITNLDELFAKITNLDVSYKKIRKKLVKKTPVNKFAAKFSKRINEQVGDPSKSYNYDELIKQIELRIPKTDSLKMPFLDLKIHIVDYDVTLNKPNKLVDTVEYNFMLSSYKTYFPILMIVGKKEQMDDMLNYNKLIILNISRERGINLTVENDFMTKENKFQGVLIYKYNPEDDKKKQIEDELDKIKSRDQGDTTFTFHDKLLEYMNLKHDNMIKNLTKAYFTSDEIEDIIDYIDNMDKYWFVYDLLQIILAVGMRTQFQKYSDAIQKYSDATNTKKEQFMTNFSKNMNTLCNEAGKIFGDKIVINAKALYGFSFKSKDSVPKTQIDVPSPSIGYSVVNKDNYSHHFLHQHIRLIIFMCDTVYKKYGSEDANEIYKYFLIRIKNNFVDTFVNADESGEYVMGKIEGKRIYNSYIKPFVSKKDDIKKALILFEPTLIENTELQNVECVKDAENLGYPYKNMLNEVFKFETLDVNEGGSYKCDVFKSEFIDNHKEYYDVVIVSDFRKYNVHDQSDLNSTIDKSIKLTEMVKAPGFIYFCGFKKHGDLDPTHTRLYKLLVSQSNTLFDDNCGECIKGDQQYIIVKKTKSLHETQTKPEP